MLIRTLVDTDNFAEAMEHLSMSRRLIVDTETTGVRPNYGDYMVGVSVATPRLDTVYYFSYRHRPGYNLPKRCLRPLMALLMRADMLTFFNAKFDVEVLCLEDGFKVPANDKIEDVMLAAHLMNENEESFKLKELAYKYISRQAKKSQSILQDRLKEHGWGESDMFRLPSQFVRDYACDDVIYTEKLRRMYIKGLRDWELLQIWREVNNYCLAYVRMERIGLLMDIPLIKRYVKEADKMVGPSLKTLEDLAGYEINPRSAPQLQQLLGMSSSAKKRLDPIIERGEEHAKWRKGKLYRAAKAILDYRGWAKVNANYYLPYLDRYTDVNGVLHPNFKLHGTVAGRPSASDPAVQAVPRRTDVYKVKDTFRSRPGKSLITLDYSQMELRLGAHYSRDPALVKAFRRGDDVHQQTADELDIPRFDGKTTNFAILYGIGARTLADQLGCTIKQAYDLLDKAHKKHPRYRPLYKALEDLAHENGYIKMWSGRVRRYNTPTTERNMHKALSNFIQGGVAEIMRYALTVVDMEIVQQGRADILLQVHDQLILEAPDEDVTSVARDVDEIMCAFPEFSTPFITDKFVGKSWGKAKELKNV